jgi:hypothetical protein
MSSGVARVVSGSYIGTGALQSIYQDKVGFKPKRVTIYRGTTAIDMCEHIQGMDDDSMFQTLGVDGVRTLVTSQAITLLDTGFSVGTNVQCNAAGDTYFYVAEE